MEKKPVLYIVIPCYNEQEVLPLTAPMFRQEVARLEEAGKIDPDSRILLSMTAAGTKPGGSFRS